ncbi:MAG: MBL fold metallo-hydrolase [Lachnospiraceae bacterium]|nr:MBL fold metallo-hydrolase [Lachnospiraceae bacterium]
MEMKEEAEDMAEAAAQEELQPELPQSETEQSEPGSALLLYQGQASIRIITDEGKVIYIDPYAGNDYGPEADLILVTHSHFDHSQTDKVEKRNPDCQIITQNEAIREGEHQVFELGYVTVEAVEAGYNPYHDVNECVGYVLTFSNGKSVYVTGDTSKTEQMPLLEEKEIDYAFFCCDGAYNMGMEEAAECVGLVGAKHNIPYHMTTNTTGRQFDRAIEKQFDVENCLIVEDGEEILIE